MSSGCPVAQLGARLNRYADEPIPDYARVWDEAISRPRTLPEYDYGDIEDDCIFMLPSPDGEDSGRYVVSDRCTWCKRLKRSCPRDWPACKKCQRDPSRCDMSTVGWVELSNFKGPRKSAVKNAHINNHAPEAVNEGVASTSLSTSPTAASIGRTGLRKPISRACKQRLTPTSYLPPDPLPLIQSPDNKLRSKTGNKVTRPQRKKQALVIRIKAKSAPHSTLQTSDKALGGPSAKPKKRKKDVAPGSRKRKKSDQEAAQRRAVEAVDDPPTELHAELCVDTSKSLGSIPQDAGRKGKAKEKQGPSSAWQVVAPKVVNPIQDCSKLGSSSLLPKIWTKNKTELYQILPALAHSVNGITWRETETPVLLIEGPVWATDRWDGERVIELSMVMTSTETQHSSNRASADAKSNLPAQPDVPGLKSPETPLARLRAPDRDDTPELTFDNSFASTSTGDWMNTELTYPFPDATELHSLSQSFSPPGDIGCSNGVVHFHPSASVSMSSPSKSSQHTGWELPEDTGLNTTSYAQSRESMRLWDWYGPPISLSFFGTVPTQRPSDTDWAAPPQSTTQPTAITSPLLYPTSPTTDYEPEILPDVDGVEVTDAANVFPPHSSDLQDMHTDIIPACQSSNAAASPLPPPEIDALLRCYSQKIPVNLIACRGSSLMPFDLPERFGCVFLGYFDIVEVNESTVASSSSGPVKCIWNFKLRWTPGGESLNSDEWLRHPWWLPMPPPEERDSDVPMQLFGPLLPLELLAVSTYTDEEFQEGISEVGNSRGWQCQGCGKLNMQICLRYQRCDNCQRGNNLPPVDVHCVRNPFTVAAQSYPWNRHTSSVTQTQTLASNGTRILSYQITPAASLKHFFTGNAESLQKVPSDLFRDLQMRIEMPMQSLKNGFTSSGCYSYLIGGANQDSGVAWSDAPACISTAKEFIRSTLGLESAASSLPAQEIRDISVLGWTSKGTRKGTLSSNSGRLAILCLGADLELSIFARPDDHTVEVPTGELNGQSLVTPAQPAVGPGSRDAACSTSASTTASAKNVALQETVLITLVHGDMLVIEGNDLQYSMKRTGMNLVIMTNV